MEAPPKKRLIRKKTILYPPSSPVLQPTEEYIYQASPVYCPTTPISTSPVPLELNSTSIFRPKSPDYPPPPTIRPKSPDYPPPPFVFTRDYT